MQHEAPAADQGSSRTATCACGALSVTVTGRPLRVYACSCLECQKQSGSVFSYSAWFPESAVISVAGERREWRRGSGAGRWVESSFCPTCGVSVLGRVEACPGEVGISVGCFTDPAFEQPALLFWSSRRHHWLSLPEEIEALDEQE